MRYTSNTATDDHVVNFDRYITDLKERFSRNVWQVGSKNHRGTERYKLEVDFAYMLDEIARGPIYARGKIFEKANAMINAMLAQRKQAA